MSSGLRTAITIDKGNNILYTFVFSGKVLERVMLRYVIIEDLPKMTNTIVDNYNELQKLYRDNYDDMMKAVVDSVIYSYKPFSGGN